MRLVASPFSPTHSSSILGKVAIDPARLNSTPSSENSPTLRWRSETRKAMVPRYQVLVVKPSVGQNKRRARKAPLVLVVIGWESGWRVALKRDSNLGPRALEGAEPFSSRGGGHFVCSSGSRTGFGRGCQQFAAFLSTGLHVPPGLIRVFGQIVHEIEECF
jgi:hypothetical protein